MKGLLAQLQPNANATMWSHYFKQCMSSCHGPQVDDLYSKVNLLSAEECRLYCFYVPFPQLAATMWLANVRPPST